MTSFFSWHRLDWLFQWAFCQRLNNLDDLLYWLNNNYLCVVAKHYKSSCQNYTGKDCCAELINCCQSYRWGVVYSSVRDQIFTALQFLIQTDLRCESYQIHLLPAPVASIVNNKAGAGFILFPKWVGVIFFVSVTHLRDVWNNIHVSLVCVIRQVEPKYFPNRI